MGKLFNFLKSASKVLDDAQSIAGKVTQLAEEVSAHSADFRAPDKKKEMNYQELLNRYQDDLTPGGPGKTHSFDAYMFEPPFNVTYTLPDADSYTAEGDYGAGEIYEGYSYENENTANLIYAFEMGTNDVTEADLLDKFISIYGPMSMLEYRPVNDPHFDIRMEMANQKVHIILYVHGLEPGNWFFAECEVRKERLSPKMQVKIMKDFEDMVAGIRYSGQLKDPGLLD